MAHPVGLRVAGRVATQRQDVADARASILPDHSPQLGDRVVDGRQVADRGQRGIRGDAFGDPHGRVAGRTTGAVGHGDEGRSQRLQLANGPPEQRLALLGLRRKEFEGE
jgi:hypothetical protein